MLAIEYQWRKDIHFLQSEHLLTAPFTRGSKRHLGIGCPWKNHGAANLMIGKPGQDERIKGIFPGGLRFRKAPAKQRMHALAFDQCMAFAGLRIPVTLALPRVIGQANWPPRNGEIDIQLGDSGKQMGAQSRFFDACQTIIIPPQGGENTPADLGNLQAFADVTLEDGMRAHLDKHAASQFDQSRHGLGEAHGLTDVMPPVISHEFVSWEGVARDRRDKDRILRCDRSKIGQTLHNPSL